MDSWQVDFEFLKIQHEIKDQFGKNALPDLDAILFLIGVQELGKLKTKYSKEEKQDLMHIAVCKLLSYEGFYTFEGKDEDGWPHWALVKNFDIEGLAEQEGILKKNIVRYFKEN